MEVDVIILAAQELGYDRVTSEQRLVVQKLRYGPGCVRQSFYVEVILLLDCTINCQQSKGEKWGGKIICVPYSVPYQVFCFL